MTATTTPSSSSGPTKAPVIDLTLDSSDDDDDDAVIPSDPVCISPPPVINLDAPSPSPLPSMSASPTAFLSTTQSSSTPPSAPPPAHSMSSSSSSYPQAPSFNSHPPSVSSSRRDSPPLSSVDSILHTGSLSQPSPASSLQAQALNLEAMSDADFDEFLKGLSWGV